MRVRGGDLPLTEEGRDEVRAAVEAYAREGLRVLAIATRTLDPSVPFLSAEAVERELVLLGLAAMLDPPRAEVPQAVATCHRAGVRIVMTTGDHPLTAESIARRIGILGPAGGRVVLGRELDGMDEATLADLLGGEVVFARVRPEHKLRVVRALKALGHVVAVTGDGVNDAPALKSADIGIAMGLSGTDVAKESADIVLTDDNFASIVSAVEEGRAIFANIRKFTTYIFTSNTPEAVPFILFALTGGRIPLALGVMHVLSIDLGTDIMPALALGSERPEAGIMDRPPRRAGQHVVTPGLLLRAYVWLGPVQAAAAMAAFYFMYWTDGYWGRWLDLPAEGPLYRSATAMALAAVVTTPIGNLFAQRSASASAFGRGRAGLLRNPPLGACRGKSFARPGSRSRVFCPPRTPKTPSPPVRESCGTLEGPPSAVTVWTRCRARGGYAGRVAQPLRKSLSRLCVRQIRFHSAATFLSPRKENRLNLRASLIWPKPGSTICLRVL